MAGFIEGFTGSLADTLKEESSQRRELRFAQRTAELAEERRRRAVSRNVIDLAAGTATPVNELGEAVGPSRPASPFELKQEETRSRLEEANLSKVESDAEGARVTAKDAEDKVERERQESAARIREADSRRDLNVKNVERIRQAIKAEPPPNLAAAKEVFNQISTGANIAIAALSQTKEPEARAAQVAILRAQAAAQKALQGGDLDALRQANETLQGALEVALSLGALPVVLPRIEKKDDDNPFSVR